MYTVKLIVDMSSLDHSAHHCQAPPDWSGALVVSACCDMSIPMDNTLHPSIANALQHFRCEHLPDHLQAISKPFCALAVRLVKTLPNGPDLTSSLVMLRRAMDHAVTAETGKVGDELDELVRCMLEARGV